MLEIKHLTKRYGKKVAVDDLSLTIEGGQIYGFIGHNGAGKTTTIKCCTTILSADEGDIIIDGVSIKDDPIYCKKQIAYIPDNPDLYDYMTGIEYVDFISNVYGVDADTKLERLNKYGDRFELTEHLANKISTYSHGMKQKLAVIAGLVHNPKLIILDEPFVGLDPLATYQFKEIMKEMCQEGCAIFFSTHVLDVAEKLCDHIAIIKEGKLIKDGTIEEVKGDSSLENVFIELQEANNVEDSH